MHMHKATVEIPEPVYRRAGIAAASQGLSVAELIRSALAASLLTIAEHDGAVAAAFGFMDERDQEPAVFA